MLIEYLSLRSRSRLINLVFLLGVGCFGTLVQADLVYVVNGLSKNVSVIETNSNKVVATIPVGTDPAGVAINPSGTRAYVTNRYSNSVSVIDTSTNSVIKTIHVGSTPNGVAVNPTGTRVYRTGLKSFKDVLK